ncbi:hypothetical protein, variant [Cryptococcus amylolentus CBS 6039]|uniref:Uncharacterized protein n=1 Tax=Cryptococcus amylolentus CBS 6039 TaxID=1295533 RepID=A0A1E3HZU7_9TREE|nr:hypothetical protein, variant [Cryptococcus amylolentus CBS 6039]ODN81840.1 hypothetical protein, variant [Cryptococcus amylolentus CBS 6039]
MLPGTEARARHLLAPRADLSSMRREQTSHRGDQPTCQAFPLLEIGLREGRSRPSLLEKSAAGQELGRLERMRTNDRHGRETIWMGAGCLWPSPGLAATVWLDGEG